MPIVRLLVGRMMPDPAAKKRFNGTRPKLPFAAGTEHKVSDGTAADLIKRNMAEAVEKTEEK